MERRNFLKAAAAVAAPVSAADTINIGQIGLGARGHYELTLCRKMPGVRIAALCDPFAPLLARTRASLDNQPDAYTDFRRVLDRKDIDAVFVSAPDHWHAPIAILACQAGKDVYCEKPLTHRLSEGRAMVEAARRYKRVVQTGSQQRSAPQFKEVRDLIRANYIGPVSHIECWNVSNDSPGGIGNPADEAPPEGLDWDMYLGPAPKVAYNRNRFIWNYRWFWDYSGGFMTDWGAHHMDSVHHVMDVEAPLSASVTGRRALPDNKETPDLLHAVFEYPGFVVTYHHSNINTSAPLGRRYGMIFHGTLGSIILDRSSYEVVPEPVRSGQDPAADMVEAMLESRLPRSEPALGAPPTPSQPSPLSALCEPRKVTGIRLDPEFQIAHIRNWLDCIRSRETPVANWEIGHRAVTACHLGVISLRVGRKIRWDAKKEAIIGDPEARQMTTKTYRAPWRV